MNDSESTPRKKSIGLIAHDHRKRELVDWAAYNKELLSHHELYATETTGTLLEEALDLRVHKLKSGPLGGDHQIGARLAEGQLDLLIFFWEPLQPQPHDPDPLPLLRLAAVWNVPIATNRATADYMVASPLLLAHYSPMLPDHTPYADRLAPLKPVKQVG